MAAATPGEVNNGEVDGPRRPGHPLTPVDHPTTVKTPLSGSFYFFFSCYSGDPRNESKV
jgi:hypothetical protein